MSITTHETTIKQWIKSHTKDEIALFLGDQFVKKDAEIERLNAENAELRREIGGFPHLSDMRQCMIDTADEIERLKKVADQAIDVTGLHYLPPKEAEGSDGRITNLPPGLACSHFHTREGWTDYTQTIISSNPELTSELIKRGAGDE